MDAVSLDAAEFARHQLTDEEWEQFDRDGVRPPAVLPCTHPHALCPGGG